MFSQLMLEKRTSFCSLGKCFWSCFAISEYVAWFKAESTMKSNSSQGGSSLNSWELTYPPKTALLSRWFSFSRLVGYVIVPWRVVHGMSFFHTPPKGNMDIQNSHIWKEIHLKNHHFWICLASMLDFGGIISNRVKRSPLTERFPPVQIRSAQVNDLRQQCMDQNIKDNFEGASQRCCCGGSISRYPKQMLF